MNPIRIFVALLLLSGISVLQAQTVPSAPPTVPTQVESVPVNSGEGVLDEPVLNEPSPGKQILDQPGVGEPGEDIPVIQDPKPEPIEPSQEIVLSTAEFRTGHVVEKLLPIAGRTPAH